MICILHHLGLGDQLMINGLVNHYSQKDDVYIVAKRVHQDTLTFMYRDNKRVNFIWVDNTNPREIWRIVKPFGAQVLPLATYAVDDALWKFMTHTGSPGANFTNWACGVYMQAGVHPLVMYTKFGLRRNATREDALFNKLGLVDKGYIFVHDSGSGECKKIDVGKDGTLVVRPDMSVTNVFDYLTIIARAKEIHCINSSFAWMIELCLLGNPKTNFLHVNNAHTYYDSKAVATAFHNFTIV